MRNRCIAVRALCYEQHGTVFITRHACLKGCLYKYIIFKVTVVTLLVHRITTHFLLQVNSDIDRRMDWRSTRACGTGDALSL